MMKSTQCIPRIVCILPLLPTKDKTFIGPNHCLTVERKCMRAVIIRANLWNVFHCLQSKITNIKANLWNIFIWIFFWLKITKETMQITLRELSVISNRHQNHEWYFYYHKSGKPYHYSHAILFPSSNGPSIRI